MAFCRHLPLKIPQLSSLRSGQGVATIVLLFEARDVELMHARPCVTHLPRTSEMTSKQLETMQFHRSLMRDALGPEGGAKDLIDKGHENILQNVRRYLTIMLLEL